MNAENQEMVVTCMGVREGDGRVHAQGEIKKKRQSVPGDAWHCDAWYGDAWYGDTWYGLTLVLQAAHVTLYWWRSSAYLLLSGMRGRGMRYLACTQ